jgi:quercetin dioxygenase-like cupin family protein
MVVVQSTDFKIEKIEPVFSDDRGDIWDILHGDIKHVGFITFKQGAVRGKHYHKIQAQFTFVLKGKIELTTKDLRKENAENRVDIIEPGHVVSIPPMVIHAYKALEDSEILAVTTEMRVEDGYEKDTIRVEI